MLYRRSWLQQSLWDFFPGLNRPGRHKGLRHEYQLKTALYASLYA